MRIFLLKFLRKAVLVARLPLEREGAELELSSDDSLFDSEELIMKYYKEGKMPFLTWTDMRVADNFSEETIGGKWRERCWGHPQVTELTDEIDHELIPPFSFYKDKGVTAIEERDGYITDEMIENINKDNLGNRHHLPDIIYGEAPNEPLDSDEKGDKACTSVMEKRYCIKCNTAYIAQSTKLRCPNCGRGVFHNMQIVDDKLAELRQQYFKYGNYRDSISYNMVDSSKTIWYRYVEPIKNGFQISIVKFEVKMSDGILSKKWSVEYTLVHDVCEQTKAYKNLKKKRNECSPAEALMLKVTHGKKTLYTVYAGYEDFNDMMYQNERQLKMCGFVDAIKYIKSYEIENFFFEFIAVVNQYPVIEQIVKAGYIRLFSRIADIIKVARSAREIEEELKVLSTLIDNNGTTSSTAMRLPGYIIDYLQIKDAPINDYLFWLDVYELTGITKEQFQKILDSYSFILAYAQTSSDLIGNILKHGYLLEKLSNYLVKTAISTKRDIPHTARLLVDYLNMCDAVGVEADKFPQDLKKQHDDIMQLFQYAADKKRDTVISDVADKCSAWMELHENDAKRPEALENHIIIFPHETKDFVNEGNEQHNCVAGYSKKVAAKTSIVYFVRKSDALGESFITGEYSNNGGQFLLSNNRTVKDESLLEIKTYIDSMMRQGIKEGVIDKILS